MPLGLCVGEDVVPWSGPHLGRRLPSWPRRTSPPPSRTSRTTRRFASTFTWDQARSRLAGRPDGGLNIAYEAVDRHVDDGRGDLTAIRWIPRRGDPLDLTYGRAARADQQVRRRVDDVDRGHRGPGRQPGGPGTGALHRNARHAQGRRGVHPAVLGIRARADPSARRARQHRGARHHCLALPAQGRTDPGPAAEPAPRDPDRRRQRGRPARCRVVGRRDGRRVARLRHGADPCRGPRVAALHQRDHRHPEGRHARARRGRRARGHRPHGPRPPRRRRLLVHRRPWLGDRDVLRHHRSAGVWGHQHRRRRRLRRRPVVPDRRRATRHRLVHRTDGDPHDDAGRARRRRRTRSVEPARRRERRRAPQSRGGRLGPRSVRSVDPRQLVADRDRRDHDRQLPGDGRPRPDPWGGRCPGIDAVLLRTRTGRRVGPRRRRHAHRGHRPRRHR